MQHFSEIPNSEPLEFPEFSATSSSSAGRRKCPACADLASSSARPQAAALRDLEEGGVHARFPAGLADRREEVRGEARDDTVELRPDL